MRCSRPKYLQWHEAITKPFMRLFAFHCTEKMQIAAPAGAVRRFKSDWIPAGIPE